MSSAQDRPGPSVTWRTAAEQLADAIAGGRALPELASPVVLEPGEVLHASLEVDGWRFAAVDVPYRQCRGLAFGGPLMVGLTAAATAVANRRERAEAERLAAPQWRALDRLSVLATSSRLIVSIGSGQGSVWYAAIRQIRPALAEDRLELFFEEDPPYLLQGPAVPYLAVVLATALAMQVGTDAVASALLPV